MINLELKFKIAFVFMTISFSLIVHANSFSSMFLGQDPLTPPVWSGNDSSFLPISELIIQARNEIIPEQFRDTLSAKLDIVNQFSWKNNPDDSQQGISFVYDQDIRFGELPILRVDYDVSSTRGAFNGFTIKLDSQDFSESSEKIIFYIRGDAEKGFTRRLKLEFKNKDGKKGIYIIDDIGSEWKRIEINKNEVGGDFAFQQNYWKDIEEITLIFEDHRVTRKTGRIYLAGFTYPESWQVAETIERIYDKLAQLDSEERENILTEIMGPGIEYRFKPEDRETIKDWILSSQEQIAGDSGVYALREMIKSYGGEVPSLADLRIAAVFANVLAGVYESGLEYNPSLYSLYRAGRINGFSPYVVSLAKFSELEDFFNKTGRMPLVAELKTGEYVLLNGFRRGGFLWLTKFVNLNTPGEEITMSEAEFTKLWSGNILSLSLASPYRGLTNEEIYQLENTDFIVEGLIERARRLATTPFQPPKITPISVLDPPLYGRVEAEGLTYPEFLAIGGDKFHDDGIWWLQARPRGSQNKYPLKLFFYNQNTRAYEEVAYDFSKYNYSAAIPPITSVPPEGRYITALDLGHILVAGKFPQIATIGGDGYMRLVPLAEGREMGASFRVAGGQNVTHSRQGGDPYDESFPVVRELYIKKISDDWINLVALVDADGFTGVLDMKINPHEKTRMVVNARFFMRRDILISQEPDTGFAGFSSMFFLGDEKNDAMIGEMRHTPWNIHDEAHDSDYLVVHYANGESLERLINRPFSIGVDRYDFSRQDTEIIGFSLQQRDRNPEHYRAFPTSNYADRPSFDFKIIEANIPLRVKLYEIYTENEYVDNIVVLLAMGRDLYQGEEIKLNYEVIAYDYEE